PQECCGGCYEAVRRSFSSGSRLGSRSYPAWASADSRSASTAARNSASRCARSAISSISRLACGSSCAALTHPSGAGGSILSSSAKRSSSYWWCVVIVIGVLQSFSASVLSLIRRLEPLFSSLELSPEFPQAARDPARDRPGRNVEGLADHPVALVAAEEPVQDLGAVLRKVLQRLVDHQRLVDALELVAGSLDLEDLLDRRLAGARTEAVDAQPPGRRGDPGAQRGVVAQLAEVLPGAGEDLLEDVLRVGLREPVDADRDRVHVAGEPVDELSPCL